MQRDDLLNAVANLLKMLVHQHGALQEYRQSLLVRVTISQW